MNTHLHSRGDTDKAFERSLDILSQLNEDIPTSVQPTVIMEMVRRITVQLNNSDCLTLKQVDEGQHYRVMQFYLQGKLVIFSNGWSTPLGQSDNVCESKLTLLAKPELHIQDAYLHVSQVSHLCCNCC